MMNSPESVDPQPEPILDEADSAAAESGARPHKSGAIARVAVAILGEPDVVLDDPPAIFGGASHTW